LTLCIVLRLPIKLEQKRNLDGARLREDLVAVEQVSVTVAQIEDGHAQDTIEAAVDLRYTLLKFVPENSFFINFSVRRRGRRAAFLFTLTPQEAGQDHHGD